MRHEAIVRVAAIDCRVEPYDWAFTRDNAARIDAHWARLLVDKPRLFDGRVLVSHRLAVEGDLLRGACFETGYKSFLSWRDLGFPGVPVVNFFAMTALRAADGAFMLGEMSSGTANAGRFYFPAGTPEPSDAGVDGRVDLDANVLRELEEETGLAPCDVTLEPDWTIVFAGPLVACMKVARSWLPATGLQARLAAFNATQAHPELERLLPVRGTADFDGARMPRFMLRYLTEALRQT